MSTTGANAPVAGLMNPGSSPGSSWPEVLGAALLGTARHGGQPEELLDVAAVHALRRRAGVALVRGARAPAPAPLDEAELVGPAAAARASDLLASGTATRTATRSVGQAPRDRAARLEILAEWLAAAARAGRRLPPELVPALLDAGRRHRHLRELITPAAGPLAGWLAGQRDDWSYAAPTTPDTPTTPTTPTSDAPTTSDAPAVTRADDEAAVQREPVWAASSADQLAADEHALARCPRPWPPAVTDAVFAALDQHLARPTAAWRLAGICELAALRLPVSQAGQAAALASRLRDTQPRHPGLAVVERLAATLRYRHQMIEELR